MLEALRGLGYSTAAALADIIDNSISAGASEVRIDFAWAGSDSRIRIVTTDPARMAVLRFSGIPTTAALAKRTEELRSWATAKGMDVIGAPQFMFYDPPFRMPWNRRNEVAFAIR